MKHPLIFLLGINAVFLGVRIYQEATSGVPETTLWREKLGCGLLDAGIVRAPEFHLVDPMNPEKVRAILLNRGKKALLQFNDTEGEPRVTVGINEDGKASVICGSGKSFVMMTDQETRGFFIVFGETLEAAAERDVERRRTTLSLEGLALDKSESQWGRFIFAKSGEPQLILKGNDGDLTLTPR